MLGIGFGRQERSMQEPESSQRFPALQRAAAKLRSFGRHDDFEAVIEMEAAVAEILIEKRTQPRFRPSLVPHSPMEWIPIDRMQGLTASRSMRLAKLRAERELACERDRIVERISQTRQQSPEIVERRRRQVESAMEQRLQQMRESAGYMERPRR